MFKIKSITREGLVNLSIDLSKPRELISQSTYK